MGARARLRGGPRLVRVARACSRSFPATSRSSPGSEPWTGETQRPLLPILLFIAGFTIVFTLLGAFARRFVPIFKGDVGQWVGGAVVIAIGVFMIGYALRRGSIALYAERRPFLSKVRPGAVGALPLGMAFAAGWTPCLGPVLTGILAIAVTQSTPRGVAVAPGVLARARGAVPPGRARRAAVHGRVRLGPPSLRLDRGRLGSLLVVVGVLLVTGAFTRLVAPLARFAPGL